MSLLTRTYKTEALARFQRHLPAGLVGIAAILVYLPALQNGFVLDDTPLVVGNPYIRGWEFLPQMLTEDVWNVWDRHNYWRPVLYISLAIDYAFWGLNPFGFHLTNVLLHGLNAILFFSLVARWTDRRCAAWAALLFSLHPIQAHAVNVISTRGDLLVTLFALLSVHAWVVKARIFFALAFSLALLSKETSMMLPLALVVAWLMNPRDRGRWQLPALAFAVLAVYVALRLRLGFSFSLPPSILSYPSTTATRILLVFKAVALYFLALVDLFDIPHPVWAVTVPASVNDPYVIGGALLALLVAYVVGAGVGRNSLVSYGLAWCVTFFLPVSNLRELSQPMAEHWLYLPMIGLTLAFGAALTVVFRESRRARVLTVAAASVISTYLVFAAVVTWEKSKVYRNNESFIRAAIEANPRVAKLYSILGSTYLAQGEVAKAREYYAEALALDPGDFLANYRTGFLLHESGQGEQAKIYLQRVVQLKAAPLYQILIVAHAWEMLGDKQKAVFYYREGLKLDPHSARIQQKVAALEAQ